MSDVRCYHCGGPSYRTGPAGYAICKTCHDKLEVAAALTDLEGKTIRLYEECPKCKGTGGSEIALLGCLKCRGKGSLTTHVKFGELNRALQEIAKAAVRQVLAERDSF